MIIRAAKGGLYLFPLGAADACLPQADNNISHSPLPWAAWMPLLLCFRWSFFTEKTPWLKISMDADFKPACKIPPRLI